MIFKAVRFVMILTTKRYVDLYVKDESKSLWHVKIYLDHCS